MTKISIIILVSTFLITLSTLGTASDSEKILRADTDAQGARDTQWYQSPAKYGDRELGNLSIQVNDSQTLTRSALKLGNGKLEVMPLPTLVAEFLQTGSKMYEKKFKKEAIQASKNVRSILGWMAVYIHAVVWEHSGIKSWPDIKGKRIYLGPASGGAAVNAASLIRALTGYEPETDYEAIKMPWGAGMQAMLDGKIDVFFSPTGLGSASIEQLGLKSKFRILDAKTGDAEGFENFIKPAHRFMVEIPPETYQSQVNNNKSVLPAAVHLTQQ